MLEVFPIFVFGASFYSDLAGINDSLHLLHIVHDTFAVLCLQEHCLHGESLNVLVDFFIDYEYFRSPAKDPHCCSFIHLVHFVIKEFFVVEKVD